VPERMLACRRFKYMVGKCAAIERSETAVVAFLFVSVQQKSDTGCVFT
jgi:hypothetical protein